MTSSPDSLKDRLISLPGNPYHRDTAENRAVPFLFPVCSLWKVSTLFLLPVQGSDTQW